MARGLAIETSGRVGSIAVVEGEHVLSDEEFPHGLQHAAQIIPIIDRLCQKHGWGPGDVEHLYVSAGPGSFTGLRIGVTLAKTMALATGVKIVAVPTVRVLVENAPADARELIVVLDAKREQIFTARFERGRQNPHPDPLPAYRERGKEGDAWVEREPAHLDDLSSMLGGAGRPVHLLGEGIPYHLKFIPQNDAVVIVAPEETWRARAKCVAKIGREMAGRGEFVDPMTFIPIYIRRPEAEEKFQRGTMKAE